MHRRNLAVVGLGAVLATSPWSGAAPAGVLDELSGRWGESSAGPPTLTWTAAGAGFSVVWTPQGGARSEIVYEPARRPAVFAGRAKGKRSMMDTMFGDDAPVNPLVEGTLHWARLDGEAVHLYSLAVDDHGDFNLDRYACRRDGNVLSVSLARRTSAGPEPIVEQRLERLEP